VVNMTLIERVHGRTTVAHAVPNVTCLAVSLIQTVMMQAAYLSTIRPTILEVAAEILLCSLVMSLHLHERSLSRSQNDFGGNKPQTLDVCNAPVPSPHACQEGL